MKNALLLSIVAFTSSCQAQIGSIANQSPTECAISYTDLAQCTTAIEGNQIQVDILYDITEDEKQIRLLKVSFNDIEQRLPPVTDISLFEGDQGFISFAYINFDGAPDLGITTSFGVSNLYLDYWVYDRQDRKYKPIGNYPQFVLHPQSKTLSATIKDGADNYKNSEWYWSGSALMQR